MDLEAERLLIARAKTDPEAFGQIFDAYYPKILGYTIKRVGSVMIAEDIVAEAFMKSLKNLTSFRWRGVSIEAWLYTIATNEIRMHLRKHRFNASLEELYEQTGFEIEDDYDLVAEAEEAEERLERHQNFLQARALIAHLPIKYQEVLVLRFGEQKKIHEIAAILGKREGTIKSLLSRALATLRQQIKTQEAQPSPTGRIVDTEGRKSASKPQEVI